MVVLTVDPATGAGGQDAAAAGQQPGPLGGVPRAADEDPTDHPQAAHDDAHQATDRGPGPNGRLGPSTSQGQLDTYRGGGMRTLPAQDPGTGEPGGWDMITYTRLIAPDQAAGSWRPPPDRPSRWARSCARRTPPDAPTPPARPHRPG